LIRLFSGDSAARIRQPACPAAIAPYCVRTARKPAAGRTEVRLAKLRRLNMRLSFPAASMEFHFCLGLARFR
jgi:hypothetical protein